MSVVYLCRHYGHKIGELQKSIVDFSALGITHLTAKERRRMLHYQEDGSLQVQAICDSCKDTLDEHPEYYELDFRSEEHTSELQSRGHLVCRLLLENKNK